MKKTTIKTEEEVRQELQAIAIDLRQLVGEVQDLPNKRYDQIYGDVKTIARRLCVKIEQLDDAEEAIVKYTQTYTTTHKCAFCDEPVDKRRAAAALREFGFEVCAKCQGSTAVCECCRDALTVEEVRSCASKYLTRTYDTEDGAIKSRIFVCDDCEDRDRICACCERSVRAPGFELKRVVRFGRLEDEVALCGTCVSELQLRSFHDHDRFACDMCGSELQANEVQFDVDTQFFSHEAGRHRAVVATITCRDCLEAQLQRDAAAYAAQLEEEERLAAQITPVQAAAYLDDHAPISEDEDEVKYDFVADDFNFDADRERRSFGR